MKRSLPTDDAPFAFAPAQEKEARAIIARYPQGKQQSAIMPLLWLAQQQNGGWLSRAAICHVAEWLGMPALRAMEVASFYSMFQFAPVGRHFVQVCGTTPCWLRGADGLKQVCQRVIGPPAQRRADGMFSWTEVECLGACANAPLVQINEDFYEELTPQILEDLLQALAEGREVKPGPQRAAAQRAAAQHSGAPRSDSSRKA